MKAKSQPAYIKKTQDICFIWFIIIKQKKYIIIIIKTKTKDHKAYRCFPEKNYNDLSYNLGSR